MLASAESVSEIQDAVREAGRLIPVAGATKPALSASVDPDVVRLDVSALAGIVEYDPAELTFTAQAATPVKEVAAVLSEHGQYLPFDPPRAAAGATLAGTVAAAASGPGALRHGGVRDFVIGVELVDGRGRRVHGGGKVVKNAAGFDLPKLMVGSMGRLGVMTRLSFKVFPRPRATRTLRVAFASREEGIAALVALGRSPIAADAVDLADSRTLEVRLGGDPTALVDRARRVTALLGAEHAPEEIAEDDAFWAEVAAFAWAPPESEIVRVGVTCELALLLCEILAAIDVPVRLSLGANLAWVAWPAQRPVGELDRRLTKLGLRGMRLDGGAGRLLLGEYRGGAFAARIRAALDPDATFLELA